MIKKIRYRLVWNRAGRLNKRGEGLVQIEMEQNGRRLYLSTHTYVAKGLWEDGLVSDRHPLASGLNTELITQVMECERVELDYIRQGVNPSLQMVREAIREKNAFDGYAIGRMEAHHGYLTEKQLRQIENMQLSDKLCRVRDAFLFCCYTGLRFSDFTTLKTEHLKDSWIVKKMEKTGYIVEIPLDRIFSAKAQAMIMRYGTVEKLTQGLGKNSPVNKTLHEILDKLSLDFKATFHTSRHTFATLLLQQGIPMTAIQQMLGHRKIETTQIYGERDRKTLEGQLSKSKKHK